jgi:hypothetical protein
MKCRKFEAAESGRLTAAEFQEHARRCAECSAMAALDARLDAEARTLRESVAPESTGLWTRIEAALVTEKAETAAPAAAPARGGGPARRRPLASLFGRIPRQVLVPAGLTILLLLASAAALLLRVQASSSGLLARRALARVELKEREYTEAIGALEKLAGPKIEAMDLQMMSLYRDKLAAIDAQIERCREALASNPANAHIRSYLLAALRDKRQTLAQALGTEDPTKSDGRNP